MYAGLQIPFVLATKCSLGLLPNKDKKKRDFEGRNEWQSSEACLERQSCVSHWSASISSVHLGVDHSLRVWVKVRCWATAEKMLCVVTTLRGKIARVPCRCHKYLIAHACIFLFFITKWITHLISVQQGKNYNERVNYFMQNGHCSWCWANVFCDDSSVCSSVFLLCPNRACSS